MSSLFKNPEYFSSNEEYYNNLNLINNEYINKNPPIFKSNNDVFSQNLEDIEINNLKEENYYNSNKDDEERYFSKSKNSTEENTNSNKKLIFKSVKVEKIFSIKKERKKGRFALLNPPRYLAKHDKYSRDDIISKIKRLFIKATRNYINKKYNEFLLSKNKKKKILLMKIIPKVYKNYSLKDNQHFFNLYLYQLFSENLSKKIKEYSEDYNRKQIKSIYKKNEAKEIINILNLTVKEMYQIYISNQIPDYNFENDLSKIIKEEDEEENEEIEDEDKKDEQEEYKDKYKSKVKDIASNLVEFIFRKKAK